MTLLSHVPTFDNRSDIKPWLQTQLANKGITIVIERSDDTKIVFKCKSSLKKRKQKVEEPDQKKRRKNPDACPFRIRANYSLRAKKWSIVIVNDQHNHSLSFADFEMLNPKEKESGSISSVSSINTVNSAVNSVRVSTDATGSSTQEDVNVNNHGFNLSPSPPIRPKMPDAYSLAQEQKKLNRLIDDLITSPAINSNEKLSILNNIIDFTKYKISSTAPLSPIDAASQLNMAPVAAMASSSISNNNSTSELFNNYILPKQQPPLPSFNSIQNQLPSPTTKSGVINSIFAKNNANPQNGGLFNYSNGLANGINSLLNNENQTMNMVNSNGSNLFGGW